MSLLPALYGHRMTWRDWLPIVLLFLFIVLWIGWRWRTRERIGQADDLPSAAVDWKREFSVWEQPDRFGYHIYTDKHDHELKISDHPTKVAAKRSSLLDRVITTGTGVATELARHLQERGIGSDLCVCILTDHSGSLNRKVGTGPERGSPRGLVVSADSGAAVAAGAVVTIATALEKCGASVEILGFTTREWRGGRSRRDWINSGLPPYPGRLNDLLHIIYKDAGEPSVANCTHRLEKLLDPSVLRENIDGEAIAWARSRLLSQPRRDHLLIFVSDGAPVDDSTLYENGPSYLSRHLRYVIEDIQRRRDLRIVGLGIGYDLTHVLPESMAISGTKPELAEQLNKFADLIAKPFQDR